MKITKLLALIMLIFPHAYAQNTVLQNKNFGAELSLPRLLTINDEWQSMSGGFSYFDHYNKVEYAFPWLYSKEESTSTYSKTHSIRVINIDFHYRKFLDEMGSFYLSGFTRVTNIDGKLANESGYAKLTKLGGGVGLGYRYFSDSSPFYWGAGIIFGRYVVGDNDMFLETDISLSAIDDSSWIVDVELLKFGYAF